MKMRNTLLPLLFLALAGCGQVSADSQYAKATRSNPDQIIGVASVVDGDTIEIHGSRIRLSVFDAPERGKRCGNTNVYQKAALYLSDQIGAKTVTCDVSGKDRYDRAVAICSVKGSDLGDIMVGAGWARDWPRYSRGKYAQAEATARQGGKGIWGLACPDDVWNGRNYD
ncbi:MAG: thermonuclease family protein [Alphaproteobacteria bacterium]|nr:thermonuclease family protein [Alphaproteobacteria bacterium]